MSLFTTPSGFRTPQWPWSVNSSRQTSLITSRLSPTSARTSRIARFRMPSSARALLPVASLSSGFGTPNSMMPASPASAHWSAVRLRVSIVCCT